MSSLPVPLSAIVSILEPLSHKYFELGVQLEIEVHLLKGIESIQHHSLSRRLTETIVLWQNNTTCDKSLTTLASAVERMGGYDRVAQELKAASAKKVEEYESSAESADDTGYSSKNGSIAGDESSESETETFNLASGCGCPKDKPCPLYKLCAEGCPNPTSKKVCILRRKSQMSKAARDSFPIEEEPDLEDYERSTKDLRRSYADMVLEACRALKRNDTNIQELSLFLQNTSPLLKPRADELSKATSLENVFIITGDQACSWFDYDIIKDVVHRFGDSEGRRCIETYEANFKKYSEERLPKGVKHIEIGGGSKKGGKQLVIKIDREWEEVTFRDLDKLRGSFASILGVRRRDLYLADVQEGCIMMTFVLPNQLAQKLFPTKNSLLSAQIESLKEEGVTLLRCGKLTWRASAIKKGSNIPDGRKHTNEVKEY